LGTDAAIVPALGISADAIVKHRKAAFTTCTLSTRVVLVLTTTPASVLSIPLFVKASIFGDTPIGPSVRVGTNALCVVAGYRDGRTGTGTRQRRVRGIVSHKRLEISFGLEVGRRASLIVECAIRFSGIRMDKVLAISSVIAAV